MMRNVLIALIISLAGFYNAASQSLYLNLMQEHIESVISNPGVLSSNPFIVDNFMVMSEPLSLDGMEGDDRYAFDFAPAPITGFGFSIETVITPDCKYLQLPLRYSFGSFRINSSIPFFYDRQVEYAHGPVSATGFGDMKLGLSYVLSGDSYSLEPTLDAKLPTGNASKMVDGFLVPLGTGSFDMILGSKHTWARDAFRIQSNLSYNLAGSSTRDVFILHDEGTEEIEYRITNGNTVIFNSGLNYVLSSNVVLRAGVSSLLNSEGKMSRTHRFDWNEPGRQNVMEYDDLSARQDFVYADASAGIQVNAFGSTVIFTLKQPVYTRQNTNTPPLDRKLQFYFKFNTRIM